MDLRYLDSTNGWSVPELKKIWGIAYYTPSDVTEFTATPDSAAAGETVNVGVRLNPYYSSLPSDAYVGWVTANSTYDADNPFKNNSVQLNQLNDRMKVNKYSSMDYTFTMPDSDIWVGIVWSDF